MAVLQRNDRGHPTGLFVTEHEWEWLKSMNLESFDFEAALFHGLPVFVTPKEAYRERNPLKRLWAWLTRWWVRG
jgi:hypothetical protein